MEFVVYPSTTLNVFVSCLLRAVAIKMCVLNVLFTNRRNGRSWPRKKKTLGLQEVQTFTPWPFFMWRNAYVKKKLTMQTRLAWLTS